MAEKKRNNKAGLSKRSHTPQPPAEEHANRPLPALALADDAKMAFLPWLALGFTPKKTSGRNNQCGIFALWRAFRDAARTMRAFDSPEIPHITQSRFAAFLSSDHYKAKVQEVLDSDIYAYSTNKVKDQLRRDLSKKDNLDITQLCLLLEVANDFAGTNFALGYVTQGWRCRINATNTGYDNSYVKPTSAVFAGDPAGDNGIQRPARPVIWLWNDDNTERGAAWGEDEADLNHWEGFGAYEAKDDEHRQTVRDWLLGDDVRDDMETGVWMVLEDCEKNNAHELAVRAGAFVRNASTDIHVPDDSQFVVAYDGTQGLVPKDMLRKMKLHDGAPPRQAPEAPPQIDNSQPDEPSEDELQREPKDSKLELGTEKYPTQNGSNSPPAYNLQELKFFRAVRFTDKIGGMVREDSTVDNFSFKAGDFLLDSSIRQDSTPTVINAEGATGQAHPRRLQSLEQPWHLPSQIEVLQVKQRVPKAEIAKHGSAPACLMEGYPLPLARLTKGYSAEEANSKTEFLAKEIVRAVDWPGDTAAFEVRDFEGNMGVVSGQHLEPFGDKSPVGDRLFPFGIHTAKRRLDVNLVEGEVEDETREQPPHKKCYRIHNAETGLDLKKRKTNE